MTRTLVMFPDEVLALNEELIQHPALQDQLQQQPAGEFEVRLATVAAYCEVVLDNIYTQEDLMQIAKICTKKLIAKRKGHVIIH